VGRSELGGEKERELEIGWKQESSLRGGGRGAKRKTGVGFNEKRNKQDKTGLFIPNLYKMALPGDYVYTGIFHLESQRDWGHLCEMAPVRIVNILLITL